MTLGSSIFLFMMEPLSTKKSLKFKSKLITFKMRPFWIKLQGSEFFSSLANLSFQEHLQLIIALH